jgi:putative flavoprotein involved in K+ transport
MNPVLIIGAGPAGLATAACLKKEGVSFRLIDRQGKTGGAYQSIYSGVMLASPSRYTALPGLPLTNVGEYITAAQYRDYLSAYAEHHGLVADKQTVERVERISGCFQVSFSSKESSRYDAVVVATGMFDHPSIPRIEGLMSGGPEVLHSSRWPGPDRFRGKHVLIIGGATSAVEIAEECVRAGIHPVVSARGARLKISRQRLLGKDLHDFLFLLEWLPRFVMKAYCQGDKSLPGTDLGFTAYRKKGLLSVRREVVRFEGRKTIFADGSDALVDAVILATGFRFDVSFLPPEVARASGNGHPLADRAESRSWPGLYVLGMPCVRRLNSEFLRGIAQDAQVIAAALGRKRKAHEKN